MGKFCNKSALQVKHLAAMPQFLLRAAVKLKLLMMMVKKCTLLAQTQKVTVFFHMLYGHSFLK